MGSIFVLAGCNGAGKSSIGGALLRAAGVPPFDPDEAARRLRTANPDLGIEEANGLAWQLGVSMLQRAIAEGGNFAFETTLGGATITRLLESAADAGVDVHVWYAGLATAELHVQRVRRRVAKGGHDIPESAIVRRYVSSRINLVRLLPRLASVRVYDNSVEADPALGREPRPALVLHAERGRIAGPRSLRATPEWAKPIVAAALKDPRREKPAAGRRRKR